MGRTFVVVGGDAAGMSAASKAKRDDPSLEVVAFERGEWVSYAACGMPYFVKGEVESLDELVTITAERFREERDIDLRTRHEVVGIDPDRAVVSVESPEGSFEQAYDDLIIATGARAIEPPFEGIDLEGVFTIHAMDEAAAIDTDIGANEPTSAAIVGGGYVGVEMAEALASRGLDITLFEMESSVLLPFGETVGEVVADHLVEQGVDLRLETAVEGFTGGDRVEAVLTEEGSVRADLAIVGVGVAPRVELAEDAGIDLGETGAIATDAFGRTNVEGIYAAGDCAEATFAVTGEPTYVPLALTANRAGRAIGRTVAGEPTEIGPVAETAIVKAFDLGAARTGITDESRAIAAGFDPVSVSITAHSRSGYYPGSADVTVTLLADRAEGRLLGGSVVGAEGAKRIDTIATALHAGMTVDEVERLDLAYAPPFSPVWDPVLTAAKVLNGKLS
ncbi:MAG: FAD-dependent oxidoreductase [Halobacteriota archaeon]